MPRQIQRLRFSLSHPLLRFYFAFDLTTINNVSFFLLLIPFWLANQSLRPMESMPADVSLCGGSSFVHRFNEPCNDYTEWFNKNRILNFLILIKHHQRQLKKNHPRCTSGKGDTKRKCEFYIRRCIIYAYSANTIVRRGEPYPRHRIVFCSSFVHSLSPSLFPRLFVSRRRDNHINRAITCLCISIIPWRRGPGILARIRGIFYALCPAAHTPSGPARTRTPLVAGWLKLCLNGRRAKAGRSCNVQR